MESNEKMSIVEQMEYQMEEKHLKEVVSTIQEEIIRNIDKRKEFANQLLEYRKKTLEEYKDDEDKIIEYFDHERFIKEEAYKRFDKKIMELTKLKVSPYFGCVEFKEDNYAPEEMYVGRFGVTPEGDFEPLIVDWRAPVASLFYKGKRGRASFETPDGVVEADILKRKQYIVKGGELKGVFSSDLDVKDEILQDVLSRNTSEKLRDIIMSIQKEQDEIIRLPYNESALVDGVAGSGKTTIALHRVAYILYNYREQLSDKVLIFGPNMIFMDYISNVLPELGEVGVPQDTFHEFVSKALNLREVETYDTFLSKIFSESEVDIESYRYKNSEEYRKKIDGFIQNEEEKLLFEEGVYLREHCVATKEEINEMILEYFRSMPLNRRSKKIRRIIFNKLTSKRNELYYEINKKFKDEIDGLTPAEKSIRENDIIMKRRIEIENLVRDTMKAKDRYKYLKGRDLLDCYQEINDGLDLKHEDLAPLMYTDIKINGSKYDKEIKHIIIDEGQDWSKFQLEVIKEYTKCNNFTIVGDKNQSILPIDEENSLTRFIHMISGMKQFALNKSYRSTKEIMEYANTLVGNNEIVPLVRNGEKVVSVEVNSVGSDEFIDEIVDFIEESSFEEYETNAIICENIALAKRIQEELGSKISSKLIDSEEVYLTKGNIIIPVCYGKGLEFDSVLMITDHKCSTKSKYVMATRALHKLRHVKIGKS